MDVSMPLYHLCQRAEATGLKSSDPKSQSTSRCSAGELLNLLDLPVCSISNHLSKLLLIIIPLTLKAQLPLRVGSLEVGVTRRVGSMSDLQSVHMRLTYIVP